MSHQAIVINLPSDALAAAVSAAAARPEWIRIPAPGKFCPHTGLSRPGMYRLIKSAGVKTKKLHASRNGACLVSYASLLQAIESAGAPVTPEPLPAA